MFGPFFSSLLLLHVVPAARFYTVSSAATPPSAAQIQNQAPTQGKTVLTAPPETQDSVTSVYKIGVLLPLSGKYQQYGERALAAIRLAFKDTPHFQIVTKDSAGDAQKSALAVGQMANNDQVSVIIGPLFSQEAQAAAQAAQDLGIPILLLSHQEGITQTGSYVFQTALTVRAQAEALASVAVDQLHMQKFAVLYPKTRYGIDFTKAFSDALTAKHAELKGIESYTPEQTSFQAPIRKLVGRDQVHMRRDYNEARAKLAAQKLSPTRMAQALEKLHASLKPFVDFEALVIPDSGRKIGLITPALVFEDIILTHDPKTLEKIRKATGHHDLEPVTLLGGSTWNSAQTLESCDKYCEDAVFVDAFFPQSASVKVQDFVAAFKQDTGAEPFLAEATAYDTALFVKEALSQQKPASHQETAHMFTTHEGIQGVTGPLSFNKNREARKQLQTLTIQNKTIQPFQPSEQG
jgi:branched-chain amino acid transport system substrate-binding protein